MLFVFLISLSLSFFFRSLLGQTDHHHLDVLFSSLTILFLILSFKKGRDLSKKKEFWIYTVLTGIALGLYFLLWTGALLFLFIIFVTIILYYLIEFFRGKNQEWVLKMGSLIFLIGLAMISPFFGHPDLLQAPLYNINHLVAFLLGIFGFLITFLVGRFVRKKQLASWYLLGILIFLGLLVIYMLSVISPQAFLSIFDSFKAINIGHTSQHGEVDWRTHARELIGEMHPMKIERAIENYGYLFYFSFVSLGFVVYNFLKKRKPEDLYLIIWFLVVFLTCGIAPTAFGQVRFGYYLSVIIALLCGFLGVKSLTFGINNFKQYKKNRTESYSRAQFVVSLLLIFNVIFFIFYPFPFNLVFSFPENLPNIISNAIGTATYSTVIQDNDIYETLSWIKEHTPDPGIDYYGYYKEPILDKKTKKIESYDYPDTAYGILASWDIGHMLTYYSHRIPNANPFQQGLGKITEQGEIVPGETTFFIENDENKAVEMMEELKTRYIITDYGKAMGMGAFYGTQLWATEGEGNYYLAEGEANNQAVFTTRKYDQSMVVRLHYFDGREWFLEDEKEESTVKGLNNFRLVYESKTLAGFGFFENPSEDNIKLVKVFEYVKGARIRGKAPKGASVVLSTEIETNQGRKFLYQKELIAENGEFEFILPYSTFGKKGWKENETKFEVFASPYKLTIDGVRRADINISEKDVLEGSIIIINNIHE